MITISPAIPEQWKGICELLVTPLNWLMPIQMQTLTMAWSADLWWIAVIKRVFLFIPAIAVIVGLWCTLLTCYTLLFRNHRLNLLGTLLVLWWDVARSLWLFWAG